MDSNSKYKSTLAFTDLLFNVLIGFAFLFIVAFILINPITEEANIQAKAEFMVIMEWDPDSSYDIDLWMKDPTGTIVGFPNTGVNNLIARLPISGSHPLIRILLFELSVIWAT